MPVCCWGPQCQAPGATGSHSCTECKKPYHNLCANVGCPNAERENRRTWCGNCVAGTQRAVRQSSRAPADLQSKRRRHEAEAFDGPQQLTAAAAAAAAAASATVAAPTAAATNDLRYTGEGLNRDQISQWLAANIDLPSDSSDDESEASTVGAGPAAKRRRKRGEQIALREGEAKAVVQAAMELCSRTSSARLEEIATALDQAPADGLRVGHPAAEEKVRCRSRRRRRRIDPRGEFWHALQRGVQRDHRLQRAGRAR